jgi:C_GCAxxG_C_C family probable redox protein
MMLAVGGHLWDDLDDRSVRMTTGFAGGVGGSHRELCGALSGGVMVIGGLHGRSSVDGDDSQALGMTSCYQKRFLAEFGEARCDRLRERVQAPGGVGSCAVVVERAARMLLELVDDR